MKMGHLWGKLLSFFGIPFFGRPSQPQCPVLRLGRKNVIRVTLFLNVPANWLKNKKKLINGHPTSF